MADDASIAADLELVAKKLADVSRKASRDRDLETAMAVAAAEQERRAREAAEKTAAALDSVAEWVERTEGRLSDTARLASEGQERTAGMLSDAIGLMTRRLDEIERKITETRDPSVDAALTAVQRIEAQMAKLGEDTRGEAHTAQIEAALRGVEERIAQVSDRIGNGAPRARGKLDPRSGLTSAIEEIRSRQSELEDTSFGRSGATRSQTELLRSLRDDFARLAGQLDGGRPSTDALEAASGLRDEIESLRQSVGGLATRQEISSLERAIHDLGRKVGEARGHDRDLAGIAQPLGAVQAEIRRLSETLTADVQDRATLDLHAIARKLDSIAEREVSPAVVERLSGEVAEVRSLLKEIADPNRVRNLAEQVAGLNHQISQVRRQFGNSDLGALTSAVDEIRTAVNSRQPSNPAQNESVARELERLSGRIEGALAAAGNPAGVELLIERLDSLNQNLGRKPHADELKPIEDMIRGLAKKLDEAERPGADLTGLEKQIVALSDRIERSGEPVIAALDRSMADLLAQIKNMSSDTAEAAERAVRSAVIHTLQSLPRPVATQELGSLQSELADLKTSHDETGKWTQDTLAAVHVTLDKVVSRLATLDHGLAHERTEHHPAEAPASRAPEPRTDAAPLSRQVEDSLKKLEAELLPHLNVGSSRSEAPRNLPAEDEILLEPGEARPAPREPLPTTGIANNPAIDPSDIKASFIAAARRAAQAAASEGSTTKDKSRARRSHGSRNGAMGRDGGTIAARAKRSLDERRRPILLGLATIVLALGVLQVGSNHFNQASKPATIAAAPAETKIAAAPPLVQPRESVTPASAPVEPGEPRTTAAVPTGPAVAQSIGAPQSVAESAAREREAALADLKNAVRLDAPKKDALDTAPPAQTLERIPNMASVGQIPANAGPASLKQAALAGEPAAVYELASRAADGRGMARDLAFAARLFEKAGSHGLVPAQYRIGNMYEKGLGVPRDLVTAKGWYQRAAEKGNARAMHNLAVLIAEGVGGKPDYATAISWFRRAAQHGVRDSQFNLAVLLARGLGTAQDLSGSYTWFSIVAAQGDDDAAKKRDEVGSRLGASELSAAKLAAERWRPETPEKFANEVTPPAQGWSEAPQPKRTASNGRV